MLVMAGQGWKIFPLDLEEKTEREKSNCKVEKGEESYETLFPGWGDSLRKCLHGCDSQMSVDGYGGISKLGFYCWGWLTIQRFSPLSLWWEAWQHAGRLSARGAESSTS